MDAQQEQEMLHALKSMAYSLEYLQRYAHQLFMEKGLTFPPPPEWPKSAAQPKPRT